MAQYSAAYLIGLGKTWQNVYEIANGKTAPAVTWKAGWFIIEGQRYRRVTLERMTVQLRNRNLVEAGQPPLTNRERP